MMAFVYHYAPSILAGVFLAVILIVYLVLGVRAYRRRTPPPRAIWLTLVFVVTICGLMFLEFHVRARPGHGDLYWKDVMVAIGTMLVVSMAAVVLLTYLYGRATPPMTEEEREAWLEQSMRDTDTLAKAIVVTHGVTLMYGACILLALLVIVLVWALTR